MLPHTMDESPTLNAIARLKLRELERQRDSLVATYAAIEREAAAKTTRGALRALYRGLKRVKVADEPMHPDCVNLEGALAVGRGAAARARRRLEAELARGRDRSQVAFAFGALLTEWVNRAPAPDDAAELTRAAATRRRRTIDHAYFDRLRKKLDLGPVRAALAPLALARAPHAPVGTHAIASDGEKPGAVRREARLFEGDDPADGPSQRRRELSDALAILWGDLGSWTWPRPLTHRAVWAGDRHRLHPDLDLMTTLLLNEVTDALAPLGAHVVPDRANRLARLARLRELDAPEIVVANEERSLAETPRGLVSDPRLDESAPGSIDVARIAEATALTSLGRSPSGDYAYGANALARMTALVGAEIELARGLAPGGPLFVLKTDFADYFGSISHDLVLRLLEDVGLSAEWRRFIASYLRMPISDGVKTRTPARGLPLGLTLSRLLSEVLLAHLDASVRLATTRPVHLIRLVDDVVVVTDSAADLARAWDAIGEFARAAGLSINAAKTGAIAINGALPAKVPQAPPRFGLLELTSDGELVPSARALSETRARVAARLAATPSLLERVEIYNAEMRACIHGLCPAARFGRAHRRRIGRAIRDFDLALGARARLRAELARRYFEGRRTVPDAWLHWPRSAGGLGMLDPALELLQYRKSKPIERPATPPTKDPKSVSDWRAYYLALLEPIAPAPPATHAAMDALARDFEQRLGEMKGRDATAAAGEAVSLAPYWRWVLATHGPDVLDWLGTYRFLLKSLVPLHLIQRA